MQTGIIGLPNAGKTTLFNALTGLQSEVGPYPFTTIETNVAEVLIPDERIEILKELLKPREVRLSKLKFLDIAGLVRGAHKGAGLGNQFLSYIRSTDALIHVVRCFKDANIAHVEEIVDPVRDIEIVELELMLSDLELLQKTFEKLKKSAKLGQKKETEEELEIIEVAINYLNQGKTLRKCEEAYLEGLKKYNLLSIKPTMFVINVSEENLFADKDAVLVEEFLRSRGDKCILSPAKLETELNQLSVEEKVEYLRSYGISNSTLNLIIKETFLLLNCLMFYTTASDILQNWILKKGATLRQAAHSIHTAIEEGFIKAEVIHYEDLISKGSISKVKEAGLVRIEGKDSLIKDGDIIYIRFRG